MCIAPMSAWLPPDGVGRPVFNEAKASDGFRQITLPCGQCMDCRLQYARGWMVRGIHEASMTTGESCFLTLTFSDENLPLNMSVDKRDIQLFVKRLRKATGIKLRYMAVGEYGSKRLRPHYHLVIFGYAFPDRVLWKRTSSGNLIYRSDLLERLWPFGYSSIGTLTPESVGYVCRYSLKKIVGSAADEFYKGRSREFLLSSRNPGLGKEWIERYASDVLAIDGVWVNDRKSKMPRYYENFLKEHYPEKMFDVLLKREFVVRDSGFDRREARREIIGRRVSKLHRELHDE